MSTTTGRRFSLRFGLLSVFSLVLLALLLGTGISAQTATPTFDATQFYLCNPFSNCAQATAYYHQQGQWTVAAQTNTALAMSSTPTPLGFFGTSTPFEESNLCPEDAFSEEGLDPQWALTCSHCLQPVATVTGGLPVFEIPSVVFNTFTASPFVPSEEPTETASATPATQTLTPSPTDTPAGSYEAFFDFTVNDGGWFPADFDSGTGINLGVLGDGALYLPGQGWSWVDEQSGATPAYSRWAFIGLNVPAGTLIDEVEFTADRVPGGFFTVAPRASIQYPGNVTRFSTASNWSGVASWEALTNATVATVYVYARASVQTNVENLTGSVLITSARVKGFTPVPTPTAVMTFTPSATIDATATAFPTSTLPFEPSDMLPDADCRVPQYRDSSPALDYGFEYADTTCYRLVPEIDVNVGEIVVQVRPVDFCFQFFSVEFEVGGIVIDLQLFIAVGLAIFLFRWGMLN